MTRLGRLAVLVLAPLVLVLAAAGPAAAHPSLVGSEPGAGYALVTPPDRVELRFSEAVSLPAGALVLTAADGRRVPLAVNLDAGGTTLTGTPRGALTVGAYTAAYRVVGRDGDLIVGTVPFGIGTSAALAGAAAPEQVRPGTAALRALLFTGLALALGGLLLAARLDAVTGGLPGVRPLARSGALVALAGATGLLLGLGPLADLPARLTAPGPARLLAAQVVLLALAALAARRPWRGAVAALLLLGVVAAEALRAHPYAAEGAGGAALTAVHLLSGALWLGGLVHVLRQALGWRARPKAVRVAVATYARAALVLLLVVAASGTVSALTLLPTAADWTGTAYGRVLLVKVGVVVLAVAAAAVARRRFRPAEEPARRWSRPAGLEAGLLAGAVLVAAALTSVTPAALVSASTLLPAPQGTVLRLAERVNEVTVALVASEGRLDVRTEAPDDGRPLRVGVTGSLQDGDRARPLALTGCGPSCWSAPVDWPIGTSTVLLQVDGDRFRAGTARVPVRWPAVRAPELLPRVERMLLRARAVDTVETVTSGFGVTVTNRSRRSGAQVLEGQPWAAGGATDPVVEQQDGRRTLRFALPALGYHFALQLDDQDRVVAERIVTPNHLLTRAYTYP